MSFFKTKPEWRDTPDPYKEQWKPTPKWATHILFAAVSGVYTWAEQSATGEFLGEPRYRGGVQSRDVFTVAPGAWQVVEARPAPAIGPGAVVGWTWEHMRTRHFTASEIDARAIAEHPLPVVYEVHLGQPINKSAEPDGGR